MSDTLHFAIRGNEVLVKSELDMAKASQLPHWYSQALPPVLLPQADSQLAIKIGIHERGLATTMIDKPAEVSGYPAEVPAPDGYRWMPLREAVSAMDEHEWLPAARAMAYINWCKNNRYCGRCGSLNQVLPGEPGLKCSSCGALNFPRLSPAVLAVVVKDGKLLLARNAANTQGFWSLLAGFVEPGERLEDCVEREVREEVGITVKATGYLGSQPWPFPDQLMLGFSAHWVSGELQPDGNEIAEAGWFTPDALPPIPRSGSLSRRLIEQACDLLRSGISC